MKKLILGALMFSIGAFVVNGATDHAAIEWEHGWKTKRVIASRYENKMMGYNIGFKFPLDPFNSDRREIFDYIESKGGSIYEGGGYAGAEIFSTFEGVKDRSSADVKLKDILPDLDKLMEDIAAGKKIPPIKKIKREASQ